MRNKLIGILAVTSFLAAAPAWADGGPRHGHGHWKHAGHRHAHPVHGPAVYGHYVRERYVVREIVRPVPVFPAAYYPAAAPGIHVVLPNLYIPFH